MMSLRESCDGCGGDLIDVFPMGEMPLANQLVPRSQSGVPSKTYPLSLCQCIRCSLAQLRFTIDPMVLYSGYRFFTGASQPNASYFRAFASECRDKCAGLSAMEIGSNDGTFLERLESEAFSVTGIDPARWQCEVAKQRLRRGNVICDYWEESLAGEMNIRFDLIVACNVLGHATDLNGFLRGVRKVLAPDGTFAVEVQYLNSLMQQSAFELIYHEHVCYFDETSLSMLLHKHGFQIDSWGITNAQCGSLRMWCSLGTSTVVPERTSTGNYLADAFPYESGSKPGSDWRKFREDVKSRHDLAMKRIDDLKRSGRRVCFYGAPAKATQLANYWGLDSTVIEFATDSTPEKQGMLIPQSMIPIVPPSYLGRHDAAIVTAWNYYPQIVTREAAFVEKGGILICPTNQGLAT